MHGEPDGDEDVWQGPMWNDCGACNYFRRSSDDGRRYCAWCSNIAMGRMRTLAHNLAIAGALCEAFNLGEVNGVAHVLSGYTKLDPDWHPGCLKPISSREGR